MHKVVRPASVLAVACCTWASSYADQPRFSPVFRSDDQRFELRLLRQPTWDDAAKTLSPEVWGMFDARANSQRFELSARLGSKTLLVADHGDSFVAINDYAFGLWDANLTVLEFYVRDRLVRSYDLGELLSDTLCASQSASHVSWAFDSYTRDDETITLTTYELMTYRFDRSTGSVVSAERDPRLSPSAHYVYGKVSRSRGRKRYVMAVVCPISGPSQCNSDLSFRCTARKHSRPLVELGAYRDSGRLQPHDYYTMIIDHDECVAYDSNVIINSCICNDGLTRH